MRKLVKSGILLFMVLTVKLTMAQAEFKKTEILILGTSHLSQTKEFKPEMLNGLISKLEAMKFDAICIENMPGELLYDIQSRNDTTFAETLKFFGAFRLAIADSVQKNFKIGFLDAQKEISELLNSSILNELDRKLLVKHFAATTDLASATLQYKYLKDKSILIDNGFERKLGSILEKRLNSSNEIYSLAVRLAHQLNLQKLESIDNLQDEDLLSKYYPMFMQDCIENQELFKDLSNRPVYEQINQLLEKGLKNNNLLELYTFLNSMEYQNQDFEAQWKIWLNTNFSSKSDRARFSLWEMRNMQISANILKAAALYPGKKILVIIGSSHKYFIEKYLQQCTDIELLQFQ